MLCLEGQVRDGRIYIDGFRLARMEAPTATSVRYHPCTSDRYVGTAHNHPPTGTGGSLCYRSIPDRRSFEQDERAIVDVILCGTERLPLGAEGRLARRGGSRRAVARKRGVEPYRSRRPDVHPRAGPYPIPSP